MEHRNRYMTTYAPNVEKKKYLKKAESEILMKRESKNRRFDRSHFNFESVAAREAQFKFHRGYKIMFISYKICRYQTDRLCNKTLSNI